MKVVAKIVQVSFVGGGYVTYKIGDTERFVSFNTDQSGVRLVDRDGTVIIHPLIAVKTIKIRTVNG